MISRMVLATLALLVPAAAIGEIPAPMAWNAKTLWDAWPTTRVSPPDPWALKHAGLRVALDQLNTRHPGLFSIVEEGLSSEGRKIPLLRVGSGPTDILLWSQMHGDEPSATLALMDVLNWLGTNQRDPVVQQLLSKLTLWIVPMLNPDGAERTQRWNAQEIDINRDALRLSTPEGRFLKAIRDRVKPVIGYNLHNQTPNLQAGKGGSQVAMALLSVPGDEAFSETPGTRQTKRLAVKVQQLVNTLVAGRVSRYDTDYTARAFGDSMTRWGTATLLIESGGWAGAEEAERLVRLNFVALLGSLSAIADGSIEQVKVQDYALIPMNHRDALTTLLVRNARLAGGRGLPPFTADLSFIVPGPFEGDALHYKEPAVVEVGDLSYAKGLTEVDATGMLAVPWPTAVPPEDWSSLKASLAARGLAEVNEAKLVATVHTLGESAVAKPGYTGAVLLYRTSGTGPLTLEGAVLRGKVVGIPVIHVSTEATGTPP